MCAEGEAGKTQGFLIVDVQAVTCDWLLENMPPEYGNLIYRTCLTSQQLRQKWWTMNRRILTSRGKNQQKQTTIQYFHNHAMTTKQLEVADNHH